MGWVDVRLAFHVFGMFLLGTAALLLVGIGYNWRTAQPITAAPTTARAVGTTGRAAARGPSLDNGSRSPRFSPLLSGIHADLQLFLREIADDRAGAVTALDGAFRVSRVLQHAAAGNDGPRGITQRIERARRALQNGNRAQSMAVAREAAGLAALPLPIDVRRPRELSPYVGAVVLSTEGTRLGTVRSVDQESERLRVTAAGTMRDLLGFLSLTGRQPLAYPVDALVFGDPTRLQPMVVVVADAPTN